MFFTQPSIEEEGKTIRQQRPMSGLLVKTFSAAVLATALAACGGDDDPPVQNDPVENPATGGGDTGGGDTGGGDTGGGDTGGGDTGGGDTGGGDTGGGDTGGGNDDGNGGFSDREDGSPFEPVAGATPIDNSLSCKSELSDGTEAPATSVLTFNPATSVFSVDGDTAFDSGFTWNAASSEYVANSDTEANGVRTEYFAKVDATNTPSYYRFKQTQPDFSFEQYECYAGLIVLDPDAPPVDEEPPVDTTPTT